MDGRKFDKNTLKTLVIAASLLLNCVLGGASYTYYHHLAEQMNETLNWMCINNRRNASVNPLAIERRTYESLAEEAGMTLDEYMNSPYNPKMGDFLRRH